tara:strand:- start:6689 stop:6826 length:138 start_codon:yes stop_codon:yes gene_type:complete
MHCNIKKKTGQNGFGRADTVLQDGQVNNEAPFLVRYRLGIAKILL